MWIEPGGNLCIGNSWEMTTSGDNTKFRVPPGNSVMTTFSSIGGFAYVRSPDGEEIQITAKPFPTHLMIQRADIDDFTVALDAVFQHRAPLTDEEHRADVVYKEQRARVEWRALTGEQRLERIAELRKALPEPTCEHCGSILDRRGKGCVAACYCQNDE